MGYNEELAAISRTPIILVELDLDMCAREFGVAPCNATGARCYKTRETCRYASAYSKTVNTHQYVSAPTPVMPFPGPRPYVAKISLLATEIKTNLTAAGRSTVDMIDEPDDDIGTDPYRSTRNATPTGSYWRKLVTRNPHYRGRPARILQGVRGAGVGAGAAGPPRNEFVEVWRGVIDNITLARGSAKVEIVDELKAIDKINVPPKVTCKVVTATANNATYITVTDAQALDLGGQTLDGGFEHGDTYWNQGSGNNYSFGDAANARSGTKCLTFSGNAWVSCYPQRPCTANETLFVSGWLKVTGNAVATGYIGAAFYDADKNWFATLYHNNDAGTAGTAAYTEVNGTITAPAGAAFFQPTILGSGSNWSGTLCVDDVLVFRTAQTYVRIGEELIRVGAAAYTNNSISGLTRACLGTVSHNLQANDKVEPVRTYGPANPFDILLEMLGVDAGFSMSAQIDGAAFADAKAFPGGETMMTAHIIESGKLGDVYFDLVDLLDCKSWVGEDLKVTIRRNLQNRPGRTTTILTDGANIVHGSTSLDLNQKSRLSRVMLYWDKPPSAQLTDYGKYNRLDGTVDEAAESAAQYGEVAEKVIGCRWLDPAPVQAEVLTQFVTAFTGRRVWMYRDPMPLLKCDVELKDSGIRTGDYVMLTTDEVQTISGGNSTGLWEVVKREPKSGNGVLTLTLLRCKPGLIGHWGANGANDYNNATAQERLECGYWCSDDGTINGNGSGYHWW